MNRIRLVLVTPLLAAPLFAQEPTPPEVYSLRRAIGVALERSQTVRDARLGVRIADEQVREAWATVLPDISTDASLTRNVVSQKTFLPAIILDPSAPPDQFIPVRFGSDNIWSATVAASQPIFEMSAFVGLGAANRFRTLQREVARGGAQGVVSTVRQAYFNALVADEEVRLTTLSIERVRQTLAETQARNRAGLASNYDVLRLEVQLANLEPSLRRAALGASTARRVLLVEMGLDPTTPFELAGSLNELDLENPERNVGENAALLAAAGSVPLEDEIEALYETAINDRTDVRQARLSADVESARLKAQESDFFPKLSVFASYTISAQQNGSPNFFGLGGCDDLPGTQSCPRRSADGALLGVRVEFPVFQGFSRNARIQQTRARIQQIGLQEERLRNQVANELRTLVDRLDEARLRAITQRRAVAQAERGFEIAGAEYSAGIGSRLQLSEAELALRQSEFNHAEAVYDYLTARALFDAATGSVPARAEELAMRQ
jgi:outer membrane protein TolC